MPAIQDLGNWRVFAHSRTVIYAGTVAVSGAANQGAELCDVAIGSLQKARTKAEARTRSRFAETTVADRIGNLLKGTVSLVRATVSFTLSVPGRVTRFAALPKAERRAVYHGWWLATKKEAKHYWVSSSVLYMLMQLQRPTLHAD